MVVLQGDFLWLERGSSSRFSLPTGARIVQIEGDKMKVLDDYGQVSACQV
ncbi:unnamed protein product [Gongylonema pulchrum]|uniref:DUF2158 domain-containing protein n=1 Tax=Gongylonema pulchrum TaxID=637853 RepID=A0A183DKS6_9BILA|nr:unnamed protein product [Gongylonema pulchrum]